MKTPAWQVNPRSKGTQPEIRDAYRAKTLALVTIDLGNGYQGFAHATTLAVAALLQAHRPLGVPVGAAITAAPYPYAEEVA
jgi:hypothetical protein